MTGFRMQSATTIVRDRPRLASRAAGPLALSLLVTVASACGTPMPVPPVAPGRIAYTPLAIVQGTPLVAVPTPGPSPTATLAPTSVATPPEPLAVPQHFGVSVFAEDIGPARMMALAPNGDVFVTVAAHNRVLVLPDRDRNGIADRVVTYAEGVTLNRPNGIAFLGEWLYVASTDGISRYRYSLGDTVAWQPPEFVAALPGEGLVKLRELAVSGDGHLYIAVGASCNVCVETDPRRAGVLRLKPDGSDVVLFAHGIRDAIGLAFEPSSGQLWATDAGRSGLGADLPPDELNLLVIGNDYGWPYCFGRQIPDPELGGDPGLCAGTVPAVLELQARSEPSGMAFYTGGAFPEEYRGDLYLAYHGSVDRAIPTGYNVVRIPFEDGHPTGPPLDFVHGWLRPDTRRWGRPVDVMVADDGSLLVSDDAGGRIYRIYYAAPRPTVVPLR